MEVSKLNSETERLPEGSLVVIWEIDRMNQMEKCLKLLRPDET